MANAPIVMPIAAEGDEISRAQSLARRYHAEFVDLKNFRSSTSSSSPSPWT